MVQTKNKYKTAIRQISYLSHFPITVFVIFTDPILIQQSLLRTLWSESWV